MPLRRMTPADVDAVVTVQRAGALAGLTHVFDQALHPFDTAAISERWRRELAADVHAWLVEEDGAVVGFAAVRGDELLHLGTQPDLWGTGLAGNLHDAVLAASADAGAPVLRLWVFQANVRARRFYVRRGWRATAGRRRSSVPPHPWMVELRRPSAG